MTQLDKKKAIEQLLYIAEQARLLRGNELEIKEVEGLIKECIQHLEKRRLNDWHYEKIRFFVNQAYEAYLCVNIRVEEPNSGLLRDNKGRLTSGLRTAIKYATEIKEPPPDHKNRWLPNTHIDRTTRDGIRWYTKKGLPNFASNKRLAMMDSYVSFASDMKGLYNRILQEEDMAPATGIPIDEAWLKAKKVIERHWSPTSWEDVIPPALHHKYKGTPDPVKRYRHDLNKAERIRLQIVKKGKR